jgi:hypothetical protein
MDQGGAVRSLQLSEGRCGFFRSADHGQPQIRRGDPDGRVRRATGRRSAQARRRSARHFERRGLHAVESRPSTATWPRTTRPRISRANAFAAPICCTPLASKRLADTTPVIGIVSRLATQKGFDIVAKIVEELASAIWPWSRWAPAIPTTKISSAAGPSAIPTPWPCRFATTTPLAHKIEAGADMFLMPSRYEPCGLNQIYSLKYGTVPIVRATGGLDDTIEEWDAEKGTGTGFKFAGLRTPRPACRDRPRHRSLPRQEGLDAPDAQRHGTGLRLVRPGEGIRAGI